MAKRLAGSFCSQSPTIKRWSLDVLSGDPTAASLSWDAGEEVSSDLVGRVQWEVATSAPS